ncbi:MAG: adenylate/guanylate cyclase domain-containing protein [Pseudomonadota bacterium]
MSSRSNHGAKPAGRSRDLRVLLLTAGWSLLAWLGALIVDRLGALDGLDHTLIDGVASVSNDAALRDDILIVAIDPQSFQDVGLAWPWPRRIHSQLLDAAREAGAKGVVFDIVFDAQTPDDPRFAEAIVAFGPVVLAAERSIVETPYGTVETEARPAQVLADAARAVGFASLPLDGDGRLRRLPMESEDLARVAARVFGDTSGGPPLGQYIRFQPTPGPMRVSYYQALAPDTALPEDALRGKILLVGLALPASPTGTQTGDTVLMPGHVAGPVAQPGVVAQAHVLASLLNNDALRVSPAWFGALIALLAFILSAGVGFAMARSIASGSALAIAGVAMIVLIAWLMRQAGWVAAPSATLSGLAIASLGQLAIIGGAAAVARRRLAAGFARYVAPDIMRRILAAPEPPELGGEERDISVIVTDLAGFTDLMEHLDPADGANLVRDYLDRLGSVVLAHGGMIDQFIGDSVVALFNAPLEQADHASRTVACVAALDEAAEAFRLEQAGRGVEIGVTRIGAATGMAVVGNFGSRERFHYTAMGDVVNTASRLESANRETGTRGLIDGALFEKAGKPGAFRPAGEVSLKGKALPLAVYTLST